jgi:hypothetical protein
MRIKDFHLKGQYPNLTVETELEGDNGVHTINLGAWNYVSLLNEQELKSLVRVIYDQVAAVHQTPAMKNVVGSSIEHASHEEIP